MCVRSSNSPTVFCVEIGAEQHIICHAATDIPVVSGGGTNTVRLLVEFATTSAVSVEGHDAVVVASLVFDLLLSSDMLSV